MGALLALGLFVLGLTGCYTQLQTTESTSATATTEAPRAQEGPQKKSAEEAPTYAREYRRENRDAATSENEYGGYDYDRTYGGDKYDYLYEYKYKYKYGAPYASYSRYDRGCADAFHHDPWYYDSRCGPSYGSRFSLSFHFGSPPHFYRPWGPRPFSSYHHYGHGVRYSSYAYGAGYSPYANYYVGNQYIYYGDAGEDEDDRAYRPRGGTIGQGATRGDRRSSRSGRGVAQTTTSDRAARSSTGRIGRSTGSNDAQRSSVDRSAADRSGRLDRASRSDDTRSRGRIGRSSRSEREWRRTTQDRQRTRSGRTDRDDNRARTDRSPRSRSDRGSRSRSVDRRRDSDRRSRSNDRSRTRRDASRDDSNTRSRRRDSSDDGGRLRSYRIPTRSSSGTINGTDSPERNEQWRATPRRSLNLDQSALNRSRTIDRSSLDGHRTEKATSRSRTRSSSTRARSSRDRSSTRARSSRDRSTSESSRSTSRRSSRSDRGDDDDGGSR